MKENEEEEVSNELRKVWSGLRIESQKVFSFFSFFSFFKLCKNQIMQHHIQWIYSELIHSIDSYWNHWWFLFSKSSFFFFFFKKIPQHQQLHCFPGHLLIRKGSPPQPPSHLQMPLHMTQTSPLGCGKLWVLFNFTCFFFSFLFFFFSSSLDSWNLTRHLFWFFHCWVANNSRWAQVVDRPAGRPGQKTQCWQWSGLLTLYCIFLTSSRMLILNIFKMTGYGHEGSN